MQQPTSLAHHATALPSGPGSTYRPSPAAADGVLAWLAPYIAVALIAYPTLIWPLTDPQVATGGGSLLPPAASGPPGLLVRIYFPVLAVLGLMALVAKVRRSGWRGLGLSHPVILFGAVFLALAAVSHNWAVAPDVSLRRCVLVAAIWVAVISSVLVIDDWRRLLSILFWMLVMVALLNVFAILTRPATPIGHAGVYPHKNFLGAVSSIIVMVSLHQMFTGRTVTRIAAAATMVAAFGFMSVAKSKTPMGLCIVAPALGFGLAWLARTLRVSPALSVPVLFGGVYFAYAFGAASGFWDFHAMATTLFGDPTLTQRTEIWAYALRMMSGHTLYGYGYEGFWDVGPESPSIRSGGLGFLTQMPHSHNGYIDMVLQLGYPGLAVIACLLLACLHAAGRAARSSLVLGSFILTVIVFCLLYNLFESTYFRSYNVHQSLLLVATALAVAHNARVSAATRTAGSAMVPGPRLAARVRSHEPAVRQ
jgi:exopolysaccharide production protein ExoQ